MASFLPWHLHVIYWPGVFYFFYGIFKGFLTWRPVFFRTMYLPFLQHSSMEMVPVAERRKLVLITLNFGEESDKQSDVQPNVYTLSQ